MEIEIACNTPDDVLFRNIEENSKHDIPWVKLEDAHDGHAVIVGGGPSLVDNLESIKWRQGLGQKVFALNNSCKYLADNGITADYQIILDARPENADFVSSGVVALFASQCDPSVFNRANGETKLFHPVLGGIENHIPEHDDYALIGGGTTVGLTALALAYTLGYRKIHLYGYDSSHKEGSHAYEQTINNGEPTAKVKMNGKEFRTSLTMAWQAKLFPELANNLIDLGCVITYDGDGLMREVINSMTPMQEVEKYRQMWNMPGYRDVSPGEQIAQIFIDITRPSGLVIDFGCGTGRGALAIKKHTTCDLLLVDFTANSRDDDAQKLPFVLADLTSPMNLRGDYGFCADVMEHIPPDLVDSVVNNIMGCCDVAFFQISLVPDNMGVLIGQLLHLSVHPFEWWRGTFERLGYHVLWVSNQDISACFLISTT